MSPSSIANPARRKKPARRMPDKFHRDMRRHGRPGVPLKAIKWMFQRHAPLAVRLDGTPFQLKWMWQMLRNCDTRHYMENKGRMVRPAEYSRDCLKTLRAATGIEYEGRRGTLQLFRTAQQYENATRDIAVLEDAGVPYQLTESSRLAEVEPALAEVAHKLTGGLRLPNDETGDCQLYPAPGAHGGAGGRNLSL